jgi:hypothetical protein
MGFWIDHSIIDSVDATFLELVGNGSVPRKHPSEVASKSGQDVRMGWTGTCIFMAAAVGHFCDCLRCSCVVGGLVVKLR